MFIDQLYTWGPTKYETSEMTTVRNLYYMIPYSHEPWNGKLVSIFDQSEKSQIKIIKTIFKAEDFNF